MNFNLLSLVGREKHNLVLTEPIKTVDTYYDMTLLGMGCKSHYMKCHEIIFLHQTLLNDLLAQHEQKGLASNTTTLVSTKHLIVNNILYRWDMTIGLDFSKLH